MGYFALHLWGAATTAQNKHVLVIIVSDSLLCA